MKDRVRQVRQTLNLSQAAFGEKIGIKQASVNDMEKGRNNVSSRNIEAICRIFNVNRNWLETGEGEMFNPPVNKTFLDLLAEEKGLTNREKGLIQSIIDLPSSVRGAVIDWALDLARKVGEETPKEKELREIEETQRRLEKRRRELIGDKNQTTVQADERRADHELTVEEKRRIVNEELDAEARGQTSSPFTGLSGLSKSRKFSR